MKARTLGALLVAGSLAAWPGTAPAQTSSRTRVIMLGTGTPYADPDRFGTALVVLVDSTPYLFDAGAGVVRRWTAAIRNEGLALPPSSLRTAFVTHLHSDHTLGYPDLILTSWTLEQGPHRPLEVYGPAGLKAMTDHILAAYAEDIAIRTGDEGERAAQAPPVVHVHEIGTGVVYRDSLVTVTAFAAHHGTWKQAFGYRVETPDRVIVLSGDAGPPSEIPAQCRGCDILLHEGGFRLAADANPYFKRFHTTTEDLARIAAAARPKLLVLYHQPPAGPGPERGYAALRALYPGAMVVARDLEVFR
jgi:ribonuclease Z